METKNLTTVTIIYYQEDSLELKHEIKSYPKNKFGRVIIPQEFRQNKSILAVCLGEITIINKIGDRIISLGIEDEDL
ncbi:TIGR02922 family protein [Colwellia sp. MB3u-70]|uniref:TIGR02922 family protein n=1 Tax=unclassified Colwellia TaxID=196834 RepID=UPI0015F3659E|nr:MULTISPECIES: TIGR02922 family protein [unclassified Colwellia]MBA6293150.1 TIGR02922 family protein [Colwellia sp. MB3u-8]MBA6307078.1 TIGR02922 family protein [Colwellia sp. MB3u-70]